MRNYETAIILDPEWEEEERNSFVERLEKIIASFSGEVIDKEDWGIRKLAYKITKSSSGYYLFIRYSGNRGAVEELERVMGLNERVFRFLTTGFYKDIKGKYPVPPTIDEILDMDITELQTLKAQWRRDAGAQVAEEKKSEESVKSQEDPGKRTEKEDTENGGEEQE